LIAATPVGRDRAASLAALATNAARSAAGLGPDRSAIDEAWRRKRFEGIGHTTEVYRAYYEKEATPETRRILDAAGLKPGEALLRWANYDRTVVFSSRVFEADDTGRAYRLRPNTRSFWMRGGVFPNGLECFFFVPDTEEVREAVAAAGTVPVPGSHQTTNSWDLRGPEPDLDAPLRVLVLGDSFMQGIFVLDDATPVVRLEQALRELRSEDVCALNTGHIGYSPEQCYYTLRAYFDRFRPHAVVFSLCPNDFGDGHKVLEGKGGDWAEAQHWVNEDQQACRTKQVPCLIVPVPFESQLSGPRHAASYPGQISELSQASGMYFLDLTDAFINEHLRLMEEATRTSQRPSTSPLYNGHMNDAHFSPAGCDVWGRSVAVRLGLLLDIDARQRPIKGNAP
jgi:hypothetical protein